MRCKTRRRRRARGRDGGSLRSLSAWFVFGFRTRVVLLVVFTVLLAAGLVGVSAMSVSRATLRQSILDRDLQAADMIGRLVADDVSGARRSLALLSRDPQFVRAVLDRDVEQADGRIGDIMGSVPLLDGLAVYDGQGIGWVSGSGPDRFRLGNRVADSEWFRDTLTATAEPVLGLAGVSGSAGGVVIPLSAPIRDTQGRLLGVLVGDVDLAMMWEGIVGPGSGSPVAAVLLDMRQGGITLAHVDQTRVLQPITDMSQSTVSALAGERGTREARDGSSGPELTAYTRVPDLPWSVMIVEPAPVALAQAAPLGLGTLLLAGIAMVLSAVPGIVLSGALTRPMRELVEDVQVIGEGNLQYRVGSTSRDEIGVLSRAIDRMAAELGMSMVSRDVLAQSEERFRIATDSASDLVWVQQIPGDRRDWYGDLDTALGYEAGAFPRTVAGWEHAIHRDDVEGVRAAMRSHLESDTPYAVEYRIRHRNGSYRTWTGHGKALRDQEGRAYRMIGACSDITERKRAEHEREVALAEVQRSNQELERFAYVASHDLQEPLRMVSSYTQLLGQRYADQLDDRAREYIAYAVDGAVRMQQLINDLLAYSRIQTQGKVPEPVDANAVLGDALTNLSISIAESQAIINHEELPVVRADRSQLMQVLQNLIANAIKFHGAALPVISISARDLGHDWLFSVKDNGIGIDPRYADRLFTIFQRLHTRQEYPGTGIGLAVCKRIVERHGGKIWFESESGQGTTFLFTLPH
jgi:PAS domain S-box-containing protein